MKILITIASMVLSITCFALQVNLGAEDSWAPYSNIDGEGISTNIVRAAFSEVGMKVKTSPYPYARAVQMTIAGELDGCYNVYKQELTKKKLHFGDEPLLSSKAFFFHHSSKKFNFKNISELPKGTSLVIIRGYDYGDLFEKYKHRLKIFQVNSQDQIISMLLSKRVSLAIMYEKVADYNLKKYKQTTEITKSIESHTAEVYVAFNLKNKNSKLFAAKLDEGIRKLKKSGMYDKLLSN